MGDGPYVVIDDEEMGLIVRGLGVMPNPSAICSRLNEQHAEIERLRAILDDAYPFVLLYAERYAREYERTELVEHRRNKVYIDHGKLLDAMRSSMAPRSPRTQR